MTNQLPFLIGLTKKVPVSITFLLFIKTFKILLFNGSLPLKVVSYPQKVLLQGSGLSCNSNLKCLLLFPQEDALNFIFNLCPFKMKCREYPYIFQLLILRKSIFKKIQRLAHFVWVVPVFPSIRRIPVFISSCPNCMYVC